MHAMKPSVQTATAYLRVSVVSLFLAFAAGCQVPAPAQVVATEHPSTHVNISETSAHSADISESRPESTQASPIALDPSAGQEIGTVFEAWLSPHQEGGEEEDTPDIIPSAFKSTEPSVPRNERRSRGHGVLSFTKDLSKAYVHVMIENVAPEDIAMFHIHCGRPGQLGPIIVDFALAGDLQHYLDDNVLSLELTNEDIEAVINHGEGLIGAFTAGCPITMAAPMDKVKTIAGMEVIAREGELYFNLHTQGQMYFGDIRGQLHQVED